MGEECRGEGEVKAAGGWEGRGVGMWQGGRGEEELMWRERCVEGEEDSVEGERRWGFG